KQLQYHQVKAAGAADFFPAQPAHEPDDHEDQRSQQHGADNREGQEHRAGRAALGKQVQGCACQHSQQRHQRHNQKIRAELALATGVTQRLDEKQQRQEDERCSAEYEGGGLIRVVQRGNEGNPEQVFTLAAFKVAQEQPQQYQTPKDNKNLVASIPAGEQDVR